ncbi:MAG: hypothetical protein OEV92_09495 [Nitrospinota bacterium]|nr:hypothetical protein [Nitrospinota bacterium]
MGKVITIAAAMVVALALTPGCGRKSAPVAPKPAGILHLPIQAAQAWKMVE